MIPFSIGMPVKYGSGSPWKVVHFNEDGQIVIQRGCIKKTVPYEDLIQLDDRPWREPIQGGGFIQHWGLQDLRDELKREIEES